MSDTAIIVVAILAFLFLERGSSSSTPYNQRPPATGNPPPGSRVDPGAAGISGGIALATGNYPGAATAVYSVFKDPQTRAVTFKAVTGAIEQPFKVVGSGIEHAASTAYNTLKSLNPF